MGGGTRSLRCPVHLIAYKADRLGSLCQARQPHPPSSRVCRSADACPGGLLNATCFLSRVSSTLASPLTDKTTDTSNITPIEDMADKHSSDSGKGTGAAFSAKDLGFKVPGTGSGPTDERIFNQPPRSWPELVGKGSNKIYMTLVCILKLRVGSFYPFLNGYRLEFVAQL